jgi:hypothetical protein
MDKAFIMPDWVILLLPVVTAGYEKPVDQIGKGC